MKKTIIKGAKCLMTFIIFFSSFYCSIQKKTTSEHPNLRRFKEPYINEIIILAWENFQKGNYEASALDFERLIKKNYIDYDILFGAGISFYRLNKTAKSLDYLDRSLLKEPEHFEALFTRAMIYRGQGNINAEKRDLDAIISLAYNKPLICGYYFSGNDIAGKDKLEQRREAAKTLLIQIKHP